VRVEDGETLKVGARCSLASGRSRGSKNRFERLSFGKAEMFPAASRPGEVRAAARRWVSGSQTRRAVVATTPADVVRRAARSPQIEGLCEGLPRALSVTCMGRNVKFTHYCSEVAAERRRRSLVSKIIWPARLLCKCGGNRSCGSVRPRPENRGRSGSLRIFAQGKSGTTGGSQRRGRGAGTGMIPFDAKRGTASRRAWNRLRQGGEGRADAVQAAGVKVDSIAPSPSRASGCHVCRVSGHTRCDPARMTVCGPKDPAQKPARQAGIQGEENTQVRRRESTLKDIAHRCCCWDVGASRVEMSPPVALAAAFS